MKLNRFVIRRALVFLGAVGACVATTAAQQTPAPELFFVTGRNVNTLGPSPEGANSALVGNPKHKQRNEASCDVSPQNPWVILCANNDYRGIETFGDSWIGLSMSMDGARTWRDRLLDGFPATPSGIGAADPVVRTVPGLGLVSYITLSRSDSRGTLALAVLHERNKENGEPYQFHQTRLIGSGTPGRFNDKPAMIAVLDPAGGTIDVGGRAIPKGTIHFSYSLFPGNENNSSSSIYHTFSKDYGLTWSVPKKLSASLGINQGSDLAVDDASNTVVAVWRQVQDSRDPDAIVVARSTDGGQTWVKTEALWNAPLGRFFDQDTTGVQFRTRSMPSVVHDGSAFHAFWSARGFADHPDDARIVRSSSRDGRNWSNPVVVEAYSGRGHQIIPQSAVAGGRVQVNWIDTRNNEPGTFDRFIADFREDSAGNRVALDAPAPAPGADPHYIYRQSTDIYAAQAAVVGATGSASLSFAGAQAISRYRFGLVAGVRRQLEYNFVNARMFQQGAVPFNGDYHGLAGQRYRASETTPGAWLRNTAPSTSHAIFYSAFTDNRDVQGYVWAGPPATSFTPSGVTQAAEGGIEVLASCAPSTETSLQQTVWTATDSPRSRYQNVYAATSLPGLVVATPSASKPTGLLERSYVVFVQNLTGQDRRYQLAVANQPPDVPPTGTGRASFRPDDTDVPDTTCVAGTGCRTIEVNIPRGSSVTRTVYVRSTQPRPRILVKATEIGGSQTGSVILNANPGVAEIENPDSLEFLPDILATENYQPDILPRQFTFYTTGVTNPDVTPVTGVTNPRLEYPRLEYPRLEYPRLEYPRLEYPRLEYDALGNPRLEYPRLEYPRLEYSSIQNPRLEYSPLTGDDSGVVTAPTQVTEVTWPVATDSGANTVTSMSSQIFVNGVIPICSATVTQNCVQGAQLVASVPQFYAVTRSCDGTQAIVVENQVIVNNVVDPAALAPVPGGPDTVNPLTLQPTFFVGPKQVVFVTLRLVGRFDAQFGATLAARAGIIVRSQPDTSAVDQTDDAQDGAMDVTNPTLDLSGVGYQVVGYAPGGANVTVNVTASDPEGTATVSCVRTDSSGSVPLPVDGTSTFIPLGSWTATCTAADAAGNETSRTFPITIVDSTPPTLDMSALPDTLTLTPASGGAVVTYSLAGVTASDVVDTSVAVTCSPASGTTLLLGTHAITCTATDDSGNKATSAYTFTISDTVAPALTLPSPIFDEATSPAGAVVTFSATATDIVDGTVPVTCAPASGSTFPLGVTIVSCTVADASGNGASGTFPISIVDSTPPTLDMSALPGTLTLTPASGGALVAYSLAAVTASDLVDTSVAVTCSPASGTTLPLGTHAITCTATDDSGNTATSAHTFSISDTAAPVLTLPAPILVAATSPAGAVVTFAATATDIVDGTVPVTCAPASGSTFPLGVTTVSCTAADASGNPASGTFAITIADRTPPTLDMSALPGTVTLTPASGGAVVTYSLAAVTASDSVDTSVAVTCSPASGTTLPLGTNSITCTATDDAGNTATAAYTFTISDTVAPALTLPAPILVAATSPAGAVVTFAATATDVVAGTVPVTCTPASGSTFPVGATIVSCSASDASGNTATGSFTVTVDGTPPTVVATATPSELLWSPNKTMVPVTISGTASGRGVTSITYRVTDEYRKIRTSGTAAVDADGRFSFVVSLEAFRNGTDTDGRVYTIGLTATDTFGRIGTSDVIVRVPHSQQ